MSTIVDKKVNCGVKFHIERFESADELVRVSSSREITNSRFKNERSGNRDKDWTGVKNFDEAMSLLKNGYQPTVEKLATSLKAKNMSGTEKRIRFENSNIGFAPIVPLALKGVPNNMIDMRMKQIKCKVVDIYYDMTASCGVDKDDLIEAGQKMLSAIIDLEKQGYRFNLYATQNYFNDKSADMVVIKIKSSDRPLDLKRMSFPLTHTAFFRVIGFDWYSRVPGGTYRMGYGRSFSYSYSKEEVQVISKELFGKNAMFFSAPKILRDDVSTIKEVMTNAGTNR